MAKEDPPLGHHLEGAEAECPPDHSAARPKSRGDAAAEASDGTGPDRPRPLVADDALADLANAVEEGGAEAGLAVMWGHRRTRCVRTSTTGLSAAKHSSVGRRGYPTSRPATPARRTTLPSRRRSGLDP